MRQVVEHWKRDTLVLCMGIIPHKQRPSRRDHWAVILSLAKVEDYHKAEEILVSAYGPGVDSVREIFPNTQLFEIMLSAYGWDVPAEERK
jgi:hypothetical protein